ADTTACLLMLKPYHQKTFLLLDIGTNGEIVLGHQGRMWTASAAAGPAFEGGAVTCGMRAGIGAVDKMSWSDAQLHKRVIGGGMPRGICGSGIIDLVSLLLANGFIDRQGTFTAKVDDWFKSRVGQRGHEIFLAGEDEVPGNGLLVFNQEDLRQFQLARSALRTAIEIMLQEAGIDAGRLEYVFLAGAFGTYVDPDSIINIGIIPPVDVDKIKNIGNAAADGAVMALLSPRLMEEAEGLQTRVAYIELALRDEFQALFIKNLDF
ncbi:MAG: ATP-binding protein, partial [Syntrophomonas sp.]|nr:ATP-binding protein [Syntrophomonas sp.]